MTRSRLSQASMTCSRLQLKKPLKEEWPDPQVHALRLIKNMSSTVRQPWTKIPAMPFACSVAPGQ